MMSKANHPDNNLQNQDATSMRSHHQESHVEARVPNQGQIEYNTVKKNPPLMNSMGLLLCVGVYFTISTPFALLNRNVITVAPFRVAAIYLSLSAVPSLVIPVTFYAADIKQFKTLSELLSLL